MSELQRRTASLPGPNDSIDSGLIRRPIRTPVQEFVALVTTRETAMVFMFVGLGLMVFLPQIWIFVIPSLLAYYGIVASRKYRLPFKLPQVWGEVDYGAPKPGGSGYAKAGGILYFGQDMTSREQLWIENGDARRHGFFLGTTGSGKALPLDTPVLTPAGWRLNGDLRPGDEVIHPDGTPVSVASVHPQGRVPAVRVWFADGRTAVCCMDHLWQIRVEPRNGLMPRGMEEKDEVRTAGDIGILVGLRGEDLRVSIPLAAPHTGQGEAGTDGLDEASVLLAARDGLSALGWMPSLRGTPARRRAFLAAWVRARDLQVTPMPHGLKLSNVDARDAKIVKHIAWSLGGTAIDILPQWRRPGGGVDVVMMFEGIDEIHASARGCRFPGDGRRLEIVRVDRLEEDIEMSCIRTDREDGLYVIEGHVVTHNTELLLGVVSQTLMWSSGFLFIDGKGTTEFYARAWTLCRRFGREDDIRVLNFTDAGGDPDAPAGGPDTQSNTVNPFAKGGADQLMNIVVSLMGDAGQGNDMWKNRAMSLVTAEMKALCELRDSGEILLNVQTIRDFLFIGKGFDKSLLRRKITSIEDVPDAAWDEMRNRAGLIELYLRAIRREFSEATYLALKGFFDTLPGFSLDKAMNGDPQDAKCLEQYGFLSMQLTKPLGSLADDYGHIFRTPLGEVDIDDVVLNRRILVVLLPALQKAPEEMQNCGKIIVTLCKIMMGNASGFMLQGSRQEIVEAKQTRAPSPFIVVLDEAGYYMVSGIDVMMAQARSLGFMIIVAGQDMAAMQKTSPQIAETAAANASIFAAGKTVDGEKTVKFIQSVFGRTQVAVTSGFTQHQGPLTSRWVDRMDASVQEVEKVRIDELQNMMEGEFYFLFNGSLIKAATFYIGDDFAGEFSVNKFIKVRGPTDRVPGLDQSREIAFMKDYVSTTEALSRILTGEFEGPESPPEDALSRVVSQASSAIWEAAEGKAPVGPDLLHRSWREALSSAIAAADEEDEAPEADFDTDVDSLMEDDMDGLMADGLEDLEDDDPLLSGRFPEVERGARTPATAETRIADGLVRVARGNTLPERHGGMVDVLVAQEESRSRMRSKPSVDRYIREADERLAMEGREQAQSMQQLFNSLAENSQRLSRVFAEENVDGRIGLEILRRSGATSPLPLHALVDEGNLEGTVSRLESMLARGRE